MRSTGTALVLALPIVLATLLVGWIPVAERLDPDTDDRRPVNIAEAAGEGNASEVVRRLRLGEDPNRVYPVRPHIIPLPVTMTTAVEAAVWARRVALIDLLDREGVLLGGRTREELACLATDVGVSEVVAYLSKDATPACEPGAAIGRIVARAQDEQP